MGTRGLLCVQKNGEYKVAQYGQYDTEPVQAGKYILRFLRCINLEVLESGISECEFYTDDEFLSLDSILINLECGQSFGIKMLRELSACTFEEVLPIITFNGVRKLENAIEFAQQSLHCEWGYVIDFDKRTFEVYKGYNEQGLTEKDRFYRGESTERFKPIKLAVSYSLDDLPTEEEFLDFFYPDEDEEEVS